MFHVTESAYQQLKQMANQCGQSDICIALYESGANRSPVFAIRCQIPPSDYEELLQGQTIRIWASQSAASVLQDYTLEYAEGYFGGGFRFLSTGSDSLSRRDDLSSRKSSPSAPGRV